jgi:hypothetical protein
MVLRSMLPQVDRIPPDWLAYWLDTVASMADAVRAAADERV